MARLEGAYEQINHRLEHIEQRFNTLYTLLISMWATIILGILGTLLAVMFKG